MKKQYTMNKSESKYSTISKIGPMLKIQGGIIFLHPFKSSPLQGFDSDNAFQNSELFLNSITEDANEWFEKFPDCCDQHKQLSEMGEFDKKKFDFIPNQILNNVKYFGYALETFIDKDGGINEIKDYLDYLIQSFGNPNIGGHIFESNVIHFIENGSLRDKDFTDDQRLEFLQHFEREKPRLDLDERDIESLYEVFQKWIVAIPNIGKFEELKNQFKGKVPMDIFANESKTNKYTGTTLLKTRSKSELLEFLMNLTNDILKISQNEVSKENYNKNEFIIIAEERLRIKQNILLSKNTNEFESNYLELIEQWLTMGIEFYQIINQVIQESTSEVLCTNFNNAIAKIDEIKIELSSFCNSENVLNWLNRDYPKNSVDTLINDFENLNPNDELMVLSGLLKLIRSKENPNINLKKVEEKINDPEISIKHKIKISIPIFLFTKYEGEFELSAKQKMPNSFKELKEMFL
jgi:hypothetical protein